MTRAGSYPRPVRRLAWLGVLLGVVVIAACSGGSKAAAPTGPTTTTIPKFSGSSSSKYCNLARQLPTAINPNLATNTKAAFAEFESFATQFLATVPSTIKGDAKTIVDAVRQLETAAAAVNYDPTKLTAANLAPLETAAFSTASNAIVAYDAQVCGVTTSSTT